MLQKALGSYSELIATRLRRKKEKLPVAYGK
jgi:hypothetical protein